MRPLVILATVLTLSVALSACGRTSGGASNWYQKQASAVQVASDERRCKRKVDGYLDREYGFHADSAQQDSYGAMMDQYEMGKKFDQLVSDCMTRLGYVQRKPKR